MANVNGGTINFKVGLQTDKTGLNDLKKSLQQIQNSFNNSKGPAPQLQKAAKAAKQLQTILNSAWNSKLGQLNLSTVNDSIKTAYKNVEGMKAAFDGAGQSGRIAFAKFAQQVMTTNTQIKESNKLLDDMATSMANTVKWGITSSVFNNITNTIQQAYYFAKDLDTSLNDIRIVTGQSADQMDRFARTANNAAKELGRSTLDYTKAALTFYQQGLSEQDVVVRTEATLKAQNITGAGKEMADYLTAVWNGYQVSAEQAILYVDKLAAVADSSASDMSQLAIAMSKVASTANAMGVDVDELNAQIATIVATTRQAPESVGTALKTIYARINDIKTGADGAEVSLGKYSAKMASLGFNVLDTNGALRDTGDVMQDIGNRWATLTREQQIYLAQTMAGQRQYNNLIALFDNWTQYSQMLNTSLNAQGALNEKNAVYLESVRAHMESLRAETERTYTILSDTGAINAVADAFNLVLTKFNDFIEGIGGGLNVFTFFGSTLVNIFSKQIAQSLTKLKIQFEQTFSQKQVQEFAKKMAEFSKVSLFGSGTFNSTEQQAVLKATEKMAQQYERMLGIQKNLTAEEQKQYLQNIEEIGNLQHQAQLYNQIKERTNQVMFVQETTLQDVKQTANEVKNQRDAHERSFTILNNIYELYNNIQAKERAGTDATEQKRILQEKILRLIEDQNIEENAKQVIYDAIQNKTLLQKDNKQIILNLIQQEKNKYAENEKQLQKLLQLQQLIKGVESGRPKEIEASTRAIEQQNKKIEQAANQRKNAQNLIKNISMVGQIASAAGGAIKVLGDEASTAAQKANATFSGIEGTITAIGMRFGGVGMGVAMLANAALQVIRVVTPFGDIIEQAFMSQAQWQKKIKSTHQELISATGQYRNARESVEGLRTEWEELSKKQGQFTEEEQKRYNQIAQTLAKYNKDIISGYDDRGNAIVNNNKAIEETLRLLDEEYEKQKRNSSEQILKNQKKLYDKKIANQKQELQKSKPGNSTPFDFLDFNFENNFQNLIDQLEKNGHSTIASMDYYSGYLDDFIKDLDKYSGDLDNQLRVYHQFRTKIESEFSDLMKSSDTPLADSAIINSIEVIFGQIEKQLSQYYDIIDSYDQKVKKFNESKSEGAKINLDVLWDIVKVDSNTIKSIKENMGDTGWEAYGAELVHTIYEKIATGMQLKWGSKKQGGAGETIEQIEKTIEDALEILTSQVLDFKNIDSIIEKITKLNSKSHLNANQFQEQFQQIYKEFYNVNINSLNKLIEQAKNDPMKQQSLINLLTSIFGFDVDLSNIEFPFDTNAIIQKYTDKIKEIKDELKERNIRFRDQHEQDSFLSYLGTLDEEELNSVQDSLSGLKDKTFAVSTQLIDILNGVTQTRKKSAEQAKKAEEEAAASMERMNKLNALTWDDQIKLLDKLSKQQSYSKIQGAKEYLQTMEQTDQQLERLSTVGAGRMSQAYHARLKEILQTTKTQQIEAIKQRMQYLSSLLNNESSLSSYINLEPYKQQYGELSNALADVTEQYAMLSDEAEKAEDKGLGLAQILQNALNGINLPENFFSQYDETMNKLIDLMPELANSLKILNDPSKNGTDEYNKALQEIIKGYDELIVKQDIILSAADKIKVSNNLSGGAYKDITGGQQFIASMERQYPQLIELAIKEGGRGGQEYIKAFAQALIDNQQQQIDALQSNIDKLNNILDNPITLAHMSDEEIQAIKIQIIDLQDQLNAGKITLAEYEEKAGKVAEQTEKQLKSFEDLFKSFTEGKSLQAKQLQKVLDRLDELKTTYPSLTKAVDTLTDTQLQGTEVYTKALTQVQNGLKMLELQTRRAAAFESFQNIDITLDTTDFDEFTSKAQAFFALDRQLDIQIKSNIEQACDSIEQSLNKVTNAAGLIGQNFVVAAKDLDTLREVFPGILQGMSVLQDGSIQLNQTVVESAVASAQQTLKVEKETAIKRLQAYLDYVRAKKQSYTNMADAAARLAAGEVNQEANAANDKQIIVKETENLKKIQMQYTTQVAQASFEDIKTAVQNTSRDGSNVWKQGLQQMDRNTVTAAGSIMEKFKQVANNVRSALSGRDFSWNFTTKGLESSNISPGPGGKIRKQIDISQIEKTVQTSVTTPLKEKLDEINQNAYARAEQEYRANAQYWATQQTWTLDLLAATNAMDTSINNIDKNLGSVNKQIKDNNKNSGSGSGRGSGSSGSGRSSAAEITGYGELTSGNSTKEWKPASQITSIPSISDKFYNINDKLADIGNDLDKAVDYLDEIDKQTDDLTWKAAAQTVIDLRKKNIQALNEEKGLWQDSAKDLQKQLAGYGITFDSSGNITNFNERASFYDKKVTTATQNYNGLALGNPGQAILNQAKGEVEKATNVQSLFSKLIKEYTDIVNTTIPGIDSSIRGLQSANTSLQKQMDAKSEEKTYDPIKRESFEVDQYLTRIDNQIALKTEQIDKIKREQNRLDKDDEKYNEKMVALLEKENKAIKEKIQLEKQREKQQLARLNDLKSSLTKSGILFDKDGLITNLQQVVDGYGKQYKRIADELDKETDEERRKLLQKQLDDITAAKDALIDNSEEYTRILVKDLKQTGKEIENLGDTVTKNLKDIDDYKNPEEKEEAKKNYITFTSGDSYLKGIDNRISLKNSQIDANEHAQRMLDEDDPDYIQKKIALLEEEIKLKQELVELEQERKRQQQQRLEWLRNQLNNKGAIIDENGIVTNLQQLLDAYEKEYNEIEDKLAKTTDKKTKEKLRKRQEEIKQAVQDLNEYADEFTDTFTNGLAQTTKTIDGLKEGIQDLSDSITKTLEDQNKRLKELAEEREQIIKKANELADVEIDKYFDVNNQLKEIENQLNILKAQEKNLTGEELTANLDQQNVLLGQQIYLLEVKRQIAEAELKGLRIELQMKGFLFDEEGRMLNYQTVLQAQLAKLEQLRLQIQTASGQKQKELLQLLTTEKAVYDGLVQSASQYASLQYSTVPSITREIYDIQYNGYRSAPEEKSSSSSSSSSSNNLQQQIQNRIKKFHAMVKVYLDLGQAERNWNEFEKRVIKGIKDSDISGNLDYMFKDLTSYFKNSTNEITMQVDHIYDIMDQLHSMQDGSSGSIYGDHWNQAVADLKEYQDSLIDTLTKIEDLVDAIHDKITEIIDEAEEGLSKQVDTYQFISDLIDHDQKVVELVYGDTAYKKLDNFYKQRQLNNSKQLDFLRQQTDLWYKYLKEVEGKEDQVSKERYERYLENWKQSVQDLNSFLESSLEDLIDSYTNTLNIVFDKLEDKLTKGKGLFAIGEEWELINKESDLYLDKLDSMYQIEKLRNSFQQAIDNNKDNIKTQQSLSKLMNQQLGILKSKDKISQYELDRANLLLQIEQKRINLQDIRNSKTKLRLRRDSQGNYTYQYISDTDQEKSLRQELNDLQKSLYDLSRDAYNKNLDNYYSTVKEWEDRIRQVYMDTTLTVEDRNKKIALINKYYGDIINELTEQNKEIRLNLQNDTLNGLKGLAEQEGIQFKNLSDYERQILMEEMVPTWNSGIQEMIGTMIGQGGFVETTKNALGQMQDYMKQFGIKVNQLATAAGTDLDTLKTGYDNTTIAAQGLLDQNNALIEQEDALLGTISSWESKLKQLQTQYDGVAQAAKEAAQKAQEYWKEAVKDIRESAKDVADAGSSAVSSASNSSNSSKPIVTTSLGVILDADEEGTGTVVNRASDLILDANEQNDGIVVDNRKGIWKTPEELQIQGLKYQTGILRGEQEDLLLDSSEKTSKQQNKTKENGKTVQELWSKVSEEFKKKIDKDLISVEFSSGGYTGNWSSTNGKLGVLHQKELILNQQDTQNILAAVSMMRDMEKVWFNSNHNFNIQSNGSGLLNTEKTVYITANFPGVVDRNEIEIALTNLTNRTSQWIGNSSR